MKRAGENPGVWIFSAGYELISITASCLHERNPTIETIALWRRVSRVPSSFYLRIGDENSDCFGPTPPSSQHQRNSEKSYPKNNNREHYYFHRLSVCSPQPELERLATRPTSTTQRCGSYTSPLLCLQALSLLSPSPLQTSKNIMQSHFFLCPVSLSYYARAQFFHPTPGACDPPSLRISIPSHRVPSNGTPESC
ncbi:hypothetical protein N431DRAFT_132987 [Stipitochalara longipes BDJ]|nr:hypothetical protein N431DRAFT_132987 [Stipitochalara longipes BDJ]